MHNVVQNRNDNKSKVGFFTAIKNSSISLFLTLSKLPTSPNYPYLKLVKDIQEIKEIKSTKKGTLAGLVLRFSLEDNCRNLDPPRPLSDLKTV